MAHFLCYQILPLAVLWSVFAFLGRTRAFGRWGIPAVFLAGAALQFALWWDSRPNLENPDSMGYYRLGHGMETDLRALLLRPKLYPLFLGLFTSLKAATFAQCLLKLATGALLIRFGRICGWRDAAIAFLLCLYLTGSLWLHEPLRILDTTLFTFLFASAAVLAADVLARHSHAGFAGLCLAAGLTALTRQAADPALALLVGAATLATVIRYGRTGVSALRSLWLLWFPMGLSLLAGLLLATAGAWENGIRHGVYRRSVSTGINLYTHASYYQLSDPGSREWDFVEGHLPGARRDFAPWKTAFASDIPWAVNDLPHRLERKLGSGSAAAILAGDRVLRDRALAWGREHPGEFLASFVNEASRLLRKCEEYYPGSLLWAEAPLYLLRLERGAAHQPPWLLLALGAASLVTARRGRYPSLMPGLAAGVYLVLVAAVQLGFTRYAMPAIPLLLLTLGPGCDRLAGLALTRAKTA